MPAELIKDDVWIAKVYVEMWRRVEKGRPYWGGNLRPHSGKFLTIQADEYILRFEDGRSTSIVVHGSDENGSQDASHNRLTFAGSGEPPF